MLNCDNPFLRAPLRFVTARASAIALLQRTERRSGCARVALGAVEAVIAGAKRVAAMKPFGAVRSGVTRNAYRDRRPAVDRASRVDRLRARVSDAAGQAARASRSA